MDSAHLNPSLHTSFQVVCLQQWPKNTIETATSSFCQNHPIANFQVYLLFAVLWGRSKIGFSSSSLAEGRRVGSGSIMT